MQLDKGTLKYSYYFIATNSILHSSGSITVRVLPDAAPEAEEVYIIQLVSASGSAVIDPSADTARLTVRRASTNYEDCDMLIV